MDQGCDWKFSWRVSGVSLLGSWRTCSVSRSDRSRRLEEGIDLLFLVAVDSGEGDSVVVVVNPAVWVLDNGRFFVKRPFEGGG